MTHFFVSDTHFGHQKEFLWKKRGFSSIEEHDEALFNNIMAVASQDNTLWNLGDVFMNELSSKNEYHLRTIAHAFGKSNVIPGNHCTRVKIIKMQELGFHIWPSGVEYKGDFVLSHIPVHVSQLESDYNESGEGRFVANIHGHLHSGIVPMKKNGATVDDPRYRCVSMEQIDNKPISWAELKQEFINKRVI